MKNLLYICVFLSLISCKEEGPDLSLKEEHEKMHKLNKESPMKITLNSKDDVREKVFKLVGNLPEVKDKYEKQAGISILEDPNDNGENYYWVNFFENNSMFFKTEYDFFVYENTYEIKYYDRENKKIMSLEEWRNSR